MANDHVQKRFCSGHLDAALVERGKGHVLQDVELLAERFNIAACYSLSNLSKTDVGLQHMSLPTSFTHLETC